jgi:alkylated DNA nucleotide flippase Atl1
MKGKSMSFTEPTIDTHALLARIPAGRWTTFADLGEIVFGNRKSGQAIGKIMTQFPPTEPWSHRVRLDDGRTSARNIPGRDDETAEAIEAMWATRAQSEGMIILRNGVALRDHRLSVEELRNLV